MHDVFCRNNIYLSMTRCWRHWKPGRQWLVVPSSSRNLTNCALLTHLVANQNFSSSTRWVLALHFASLVSDTHFCVHSSDFVWVLASFLFSVLILLIGCRVLFPSSKHHLSCNDSLEDKRQDYQICSVLFAVTSYIGVPLLFDVFSTF